jgi:hypothetical protein
MPTRSYLLRQIKKTRDASKLNNTEFHDLHLSPKIIKISKSRRKKRTGLEGVCGNVGKRKPHSGFWWVHLKERDYLVDPGTGGRIRTRRHHSSVSINGQVESSCKHGSASSESKERLTESIM